MISSRESPVLETGFIRDGQTIDALDQLSGPSVEDAPGVPTYDFMYWLHKGEENSTKVYNATRAHDIIAFEYVGPRASQEALRQHLNLNSWGGYSEANQEANRQYFLSFFADHHHTLFNKFITESTNRGQIFLPLDIASDNPTYSGLESKRDSAEADLHESIFSGDDTATLIAKQADLTTLEATAIQLRDTLVSSQLRTLDAYLRGRNSSASVAVLLGIVHTASSHTIAREDLPVRRTFVPTLPSTQSPEVHRYSYDNQAIRILLTNKPLPESIVKRVLLENLSMLGSPNNVHATFAQQPDMYRRPIQQADDRSVDALLEDITQLTKRRRSMKPEATVKKIDALITKTLGKPGY